jgi:hypothetical protein
MDILTREQLEQKRDRAYKIETVPHPDPEAAGRGETVKIRLRSMFGGEWISLVRSLTKPDGTRDQWRNENYTQLVLAFCLVNKAGKRILTDDDLNTAWWKTQSKGFLSAAIEAAMDFSGVSAETAEDSRKNLPTIPGCDPSTESQTDAGIEPPEILSTTLG